MDIFDVETIQRFYDFINIYILIIAVLLQATTIFFLIALSSEFIYHEIFLQLYFKIKFIINWDETTQLVFYFEEHFNEHFNERNWKRFFFKIKSFLKDTYIFLCENLKK